MENLRSTCPIAAFLDLWGDRWTLLVLRDLYRGKSRFAELQASAEAIPPSILTQRLKVLVAGGYVSRAAYSEHPPRHDYALTEKGRSLVPVLLAMAAWSEENLPGVESVSPRHGAHSA